MENSEKSEPEIKDISDNYNDALVGSDELTKKYHVISFLAPFVEVVRKSDNARGIMEFVHSPRVYFNFVKDSDADKDEEYKSDMASANPWNAGIK